LNPESDRPKTVVARCARRVAADVPQLVARDHTNPTLQRLKPEWEWMSLGEECWTGWRHSRWGQVPLLPSPVIVRYRFSYRHLIATSHYETPLADLCRWCQVPGLWHREVPPRIWATLFHTSMSQCQQSSAKLPEKSALGAGLSAPAVRAQHAGQAKTMKHRSENLFAKEVGFSACTRKQSHDLGRMRSGDGSETGTGDAPGLVASQTVHNSTGARGGRSE